MLVLMAIMLIQVFNPRQGGLIVGVAGLMFQLVPLLWFWVGRAYGNRAFLQTLLFRIVFPLSILAMVFGLYQNFFGYLPYQLEWYHTAGYTALGSPESGLAPISFFASGTEHGIFLSLGVILCWSLALLNKNRLALLLTFIFIGALLLTGTRGPVAKSLMMMAGLWAIMGRSMTTWILRGTLALAIAGLGLFWTLSQATGSLNAPSHIQNKLERQASEFVQAPTGTSTGRVSTLNHLGMLLHGYQLGIQQPLGSGLGAGTKAAKKFGSHSSTETDLGDSLRSLGIPGGAVYHVLVFLLILGAFRTWQRDGGPLSMAILGFMGVTFFSWLGGGGYGVQPLLWFCLGSMCKLRQQSAYGTRSLV